MQKYFFTSSCNRQKSLKAGTLSIEILDEKIKHPDLFALSKAISQGVKYVFVLSLVIA